MADDTSDIREFYNNSVEKEDGRLDRHQIEREMTWRYLDKYLPRRGKILEVGCATGAYTIGLGKRGYSVTAVDFSTKELDVCRRKVRDEKLQGRVSCIEADARDLSGVTENDYDAALIMGPLYHLILEEDRIEAIKQVHNLLKPNGMLFSTFVSRYGLWRDVLASIPDYILKEKEVKSVLEQGRDSELAQWQFNFRGYFARPEEIVPLLEKAGFQTLALGGLETGGVGDQLFNELKGKLRQRWLDLFFSISTQPSIVGASPHIMYVGKKSRLN